MKSGPMQFTDEEWVRKHGYTEQRGGETWVWNSMSMQWIVSCDGRSWRVDPDHERMRADLEAAHIIAAVRRLTSLPKKHLTVVR